MTKRTLHPGLMAIFAPMKDRLPGLAFVAVLTAVAWIAASCIDLVGAVLTGLVLGLVVGNVVRLPVEMRSGISYGGKQMLELAIIFLGFGISFTTLSGLGWQTGLLLAVVVFGMVPLSIVLSRAMGCKGATGYLVGFGTAICGASAIAALAPDISDDEEDAGVAIAVVNLLGLVGMLVLPALLPHLNLSDVQAGTLQGGSLQAVGNVAGAGYALGDEVGEIAVATKLGRVALLTPGLLLARTLLQRGDGGLSFKLPPYLWAFIAVTVLVSVVDLPPVLLGALKTTGKVLLTAAMTAIGLRMSLRDLVDKGGTALVFGALLFVLQGGLVLAALVLFF